MKPITKTILLVLTVCLLGAYLLWAVCILPDRQQESVCNYVDIVVTDSTERQFLSRAAIRCLLETEHLYPLHQKYADISTHEIEKRIQAHPYLKNVECYKTQEGTVCIRATQRTPKLRILGDENYYVDTDREIMPVGETTATYVPIVTGRVPRAMATNELYDFVTFMEDNAFWNAQIRQIHITPHRQVELVPTVGDHTIILGDIRDYEEKLHRLRIFYDELAHIGWQDWDEIDLRFRGQVITRTNK